MKERFQNLAVGDDITLRLFAFNANAPRDFSSVEKVEIYYLDPTAVTVDNKDGRMLVKTLEGSDITNDNVGEYSFEITLEKDVFVIGSYMDVWTVIRDGTDVPSTIKQWFEIYPSLWFTTPSPLAYDFQFDFRPNKIRKGSRRYLIINVTPNVPTTPDLEKYYTALIVSAPLKIYIELACGPCMPPENDLRLIVDGDAVVHRERCDAFYQIDTADYDEGVYNVWVEMELGGSLYISEKQQLQIF